MWILSYSNEPNVEQLKSFTFALKILILKLDVVPHLPFIQLTVFHLRDDFIHRQGLQSITK